MSIQLQVQDYYGKILQGSDDLKTNACCTIIEYSEIIKQTLGLISEDVASHYYGCGLTIPTKVENLRVLDLGSGSGRDCYLLSALVGEKGSVLGIDMTNEQLEIANRNIDYHTKAFGYATSNVEFRKGEIEKLDQVNLADEEFDLIISNCVLNLSSDKEAVLRHAFRILKEGGEFYFSDVYADRRIPSHLVDDPVLYGECLSGALYWNDFIQLARKVGFADPRIVETSAIEMKPGEISEKIGDIKFSSITYRLFKITNLELNREDYGQRVSYKGSVIDNSDQLLFDEANIFPVGESVAVCGNTFRILKESRYIEDFDFVGSTKTHLGSFAVSGVISQMAIDGISASKKKGCC